VVGLLIFYFSWQTAVPYAVGSRLLHNMHERYFKEQAELHLNNSAHAGVELGVLLRQERLTYKAPELLNTTNILALSTLAD
jgi:hypothetical protein